MRDAVGDSEPESWYQKMKCEKNISKCSQTRWEEQ